MMRGCVVFDELDTRQTLDKKFTLKDEAAKSTLRSSKRLWQDHGQKLRNSPVMFIQAREIYDPGQYLRDQIQANATAQRVTTDSGRGTLVSDTSDIDDTRDFARDTGLSDHSGSACPNSYLSEDEENHSGEAHAIIRLQVATPLTTNTNPEDHASISDIEAISLKVGLCSAASDDSSDYSLERDVASAVQDLQLDDGGAFTNFNEHKANLDAVLVSLDRAEQENDKEEDDVGPEDSEHPPLHEREDLFFVDIEGEPLASGSNGPNSFEDIRFQPRKLHAQTSPEPANAVLATPWARIIDDPVGIVPQPLAREKSSRAHAGPPSRRASRSSTQKLPCSQRTKYNSRQSELDIMLDYMENAKWSDDDDSETDSTSCHQSAILLEADTDHIQSLEDSVASPIAHEEELSESSITSSDDDDGDDTDVDDDLELTIAAEVEEMVFDLGYSRRRASRTERSDFHQELADSALYTEDFNVYDYFSTEVSKEEQEMRGDLLAASGAKKRGLNKFIYQLDLSDEELETALVNQWKKDRSSKRLKKRDREALHKQGSIGKKSKRARASHKIDSGGHDQLDAIHEQIKRFVCAEEYAGIEQLPMPAMVKPIRRAAHIVSQIYGLKSASQGSGKKRYITFYKTQRSVVPDADFVDETLFRARRSLGFNSKFRDALLPESAMVPGSKLSARSSRGKSGASGGSRLRDGDLVGADAPEISLENRGRQMLERLGWSSGSGLGAVGNQGMNIPLFAKIKISKVGLGT